MFSSSNDNGGGGVGYFLLVVDGWGRGVCHSHSHAYSVWGYKGRVGLLGDRGWDVVVSSEAKEGEVEDDNTTSTMLLKCRPLIDSDRHRDHGSGLDLTRILRCVAS